MIDVRRSMEVAVPQTETEIDTLVAMEAQSIVDEYDYKPGVMKYDGGAFQVEDAGFVAMEISAVWLLSRKTRAYWGQEESAERPLCSTLDGRTGTWWENNTLIPCRDCQYNAWGSDPKGGKGMACKESRLLVGLVKGLQGPIRMRLSIMSIKPWDAYASGLARQARPTAPFAVYTKSKLVKHQGEGSIVYYTCTFEMAGRLSGAELAEAVNQRRKALEALERATETAAQSFAADVIQDEQPPVSDSDLPF